MKATILTLVLLCASTLAKSSVGRRGLQQIAPILKLVGQGEYEKALNYTTAPALANNSIPTRAYVNPPNLDVTPLVPQFFPTRSPGRAKVRYGPFPLDPMDQHEGMVNEVLINIPMPCKNCTITHMQVSLEYPNGTTANANTGLWLHHMLIINFQRTDTVCGRSFSGIGQRWFASGNERTPASFSMNGRVPSGYYIAPGDVMVMVMELMNQGMYSQDAVPTIDYEWIDGLPTDFYQVKPIWLDIGGCDGGSVMPTKGDEFSYASPSYTANFNGQILGIGAHLHDGGMNLEIWQDVRHQICNSVARYGLTPGYIDAPGTSMTMPMAPMFVPMMHISNMSVCYAPLQYNYQAGGIKNGTILQIVANYNFTERMPMLTLDGDYDEIMGISLIYAAENMTTAVLKKYLSSTTPLPFDTVPPLTGMYGIGMMPTGGDDENGSSDSSNSTTSGMSMMGMGGMDMPTCNPMRDSPGTITLQGLNTSDDSTMNTLLTAILCDTCLQAWSAPYAEYFWYGIIVVIGIFSITRALTWNTHVLRKHEASKVRPDVYEMHSAISYASSAVYRQVRRISYLQHTPISLPAFIKIPPVGILLMIVGYFAVLIALEFTHAKTGDLQTWQFLGVRAAWLSVAQLPLIILLSAKRNLITLVTAITYERLNVLHRWTARGLLMTTVMHFGFQWYGWVQAGVVQYELSDSCVPTGAAALAMVLWMNFSTLAPFRNVWYELFVLQHIVTFFGLIIAVAYHVPSTAPYALTYIYISAALYLVTKIYQLAVYTYHNIRPARAALYPISDHITKITIKSPRNIKSWAPGSFVQLSIPRLGLLQSHPASIASTPRSHSGDLVFFLLRRGGFTRKLAQADMSPTRTYMALIDGPYGASQHDLAAFHTTSLFAGSTGITFILPILMDIAQRAQRVNLPLKRIFIVWSLKDTALVTALQGEITSAVRDLHTVGITAEVSIHITGSTLPPSNPFLSTPAQERDAKSTTSNPPQSISSNSEHEPYETNHTHPEKDRIAAVRSLSSNSDSSSDTDRFCKSVQVVSGRPNLDGFLETVQRACEGEMGVAVCGPLSMSVQIRNQVARMQGRGGVYLHVEGFSW